jgi:sugar phosphate isomerase/epimerase
VIRKTWPLGLIVPVQDPTPFSVFSPRDWPESLARVSQGGYESVELAITDPTKVLPFELGEALGKTGLKMVAVTTGQAFWKEGLSLSSPDPTVRKKAIARIKAHMNLAKPFGAVVIVGLLRGKEGERDLLRDALRECAEFQPSVKLALEPLNRYETNLINTVSEALELLEGVDMNNVGLLFDLFHANIEEVSLARAIKTAGDRIFHVHLADSNRWIPGFGHLCFSEIWEALESVGYQGSVVLECLPKPAPQHLFPASEVRKRVGLGNDSYTKPNW